MPIVVLLALLLAFPAPAGEAQCIACCQAGGLVTCRPLIRLFGEGSQVASEQGAWRILGLWFVSCDGRARFEAGATAATATMPVDGELILAGTAPQALSCFRQSCALPAEACLRTEAGGRVRLLDCADGVALTGSRLKQPGPTPAELPVPVPRPETAEPPGPRPGAGVAVLDAPLVIEVPSPPLSLECSTPAALRTESRRRVEMGDEDARRGDVQQAVDEYRAALSLDRCNGYAWAALGTVAARAGQQDEAAIALSQAVQILPRHYNAWTDLGAAYEALGQVELAREAYRAALQARPGHQPAEEALARLDRTQVR